MTTACEELVSLAVIAQIGVTHDGAEDERRHVDETRLRGVEVVRCTDMSQRPVWC